LRLQIVHTNGWSDSYIPQKRFVRREYNKILVPLVQFQICSHHTVKLKLFNVAFINLSIDYDISNSAYLISPQ